MVNVEKFKSWITTDAPLQTSGGARWADYPSERNGLLVGMLELACDDEESRHQFTLFLFGVASTKKLHTRDRNRLLAWLNPRKFAPDEPIPPDYLAPAVRGQNGDWCIRAKARETAQAVVRAARAGAGQVEMELTP